MDISPTALRPFYKEQKLKPSDVMAWTLERLQKADQSGVWISTIDPKQAMLNAKAMDARIDEIDNLPLYGLILSVKDCIDMAGEPTTSACPEYSYIASKTAPAITLLLEAGALYIGKTNMDQFATGLVGVRTPYGIARNPHNPAYIPGGSSSGAGVSIATGTSSIALGTDTGGSGRVPASYNGVTGFKPSPGSISKRGMVYACRSFDTISIYTKTPEDALTTLQVMAVHDKEDAFSDPSYDIDHALKSKGEHSNIRLAVPRVSQRRFFGNTETERLFQEAEQISKAAFSDVKETDFSVFTDINELMFFGPFVAERDVSVGGFLRENPVAAEPVVREIIIASNKWSAADAYRAQYELMEAKRKTDEVWTEYDALMVPTVGNVYKIEDIEADPLGPNFTNGYYTNYANPLGLVGISVPNAVTGDGVPYGVTFLGPKGSDTLVIKVAQDFLKAKSLE
ncbi:MAG: allophanate hydrolase [Methyloligellaceae bacterium]